MLDVARAQEVRMQRMDLAFLDGVVGGGQGLAQHLLAEHTAAADVATLAAEIVVLYPLKLQQPQQICQNRLHQSLS